MSKEWGNVRYSEGRWYKEREGKAADEQKDVSKGEGGLVAVMRWFVIV